jgi:hypothetical protein
MLACVFSILLFCFFDDVLFCGLAHLRLGIFENHALRSFALILIYIFTLILFCSYVFLYFCSFALMCMRWAESLPRSRGRAGGMAANRHASAVCSSENFNVWKTRTPVAKFYDGIFDGILPGHFSKFLLYFRHIG